MSEQRHLMHRGSAFSSTLPSLFGGCDEDELASMTEEVALSDGYDCAVFVQVKHRLLQSCKYINHPPIQTFIQQLCSEKI